MQIITTNLTMSEIEWLTNCFSRNKSGFGRAQFDAEDDIKPAQIGDSQVKTPSTTVSVRILGVARSATRLSAGPFLLGQ